VRYGLGVGNKLMAIKAATDGAYRFIMLGFMIVEITLLGVLVWIEATHK
jgi:hypothetical protein